MVQINKNQKNKVHKVKHNVPILINNNTQCIEVKDDKESLECPICYEKIQKNNYIVTKCNHTFCNDCLFKSLSSNSCCPICREDIFTFSKIKSLTLDDIHYLEDRTFLTRNIFIRSIVNNIITIIQHSLENNECYCADDETKKTLNTYFRCNNFQNILNNTLNDYLNKSFKGFSLYCYENLYKWLKN
jgi:hypothetical protein